MFSLKQKIFFGYLLIFLIFLALLFPFSKQLVDRIVIKTMQDRTNSLIETLQTARNNEGLITLLKQQKAYLFFRVAVISNERKLLYDSHTKRILGGRFSQEYIVDHPEVHQAFKKGVGSYEDYSELLKQRFLYIAKAFDFHGKTYVIRAAFPISYVTQLTHDFEAGFFFLGSVILILFSVLTYTLINRITKPIQRIIEAVQPYSEKSLALLPKVPLPEGGPKDDVSKLALVLNSLSSNIEMRIDDLTKEKNEKAAVLEALHEGVLAVDHNFCINYVNQAALDILDIKIMPSDILSEDVEKTAYSLLKESMEKEETLTRLVELKPPFKGSMVHLFFTASPLKNQEGAILVVQDQSQQFKILEMRKNFIANASHELKTPITIIRGFAETLHENPELSNEMIKEITQKIVNNCLRMNNLVKDLLTLSDIEHIPESRIERIDLKAHIEHCIHLVKDAHPDALISLEAKREKNFIECDPQLIEMLFFNLIENGVKYSDPPAIIDIFIGCSQEEYTISIKDQGIGIAVDDLEKVFQRFFTANKARSRKTGGSGLGLSIVQTIVEKHGGKIEVESIVDKGSTFKVFLPKKHQ